MPSRYLSLLTSEPPALREGLRRLRASLGVPGAFPAEVLAALQPESVVPAMLVLTHESAPTRTILCAGGGGFEAAHITLTQGIYLGTGALVAEQLAKRLAETIDGTGQQVPQSGAAQGTLEVGKAMAARR